MPLVTTIKERCRVCYTCVRECPAKAIRIVEQQAEVMPERCIGCGNCVRVCSQHAKRVTSDLDHVQALLKGSDPVAAILAPSFPAEFVDIEYEIFVGMLRSLGFRLVNEVGFGADLVAAKYRHLLERNPDERYIATTCPAIIGYVERYHPELVPFLAPIVSPMLATARMLHRRHGDNLRIVFIGPCIAKKGEATSDAVVGEVDAVMTFVELGLLFEMANVSPSRVEPSDFDPPHGAYGGLFPISRGMLQAANLEEDLVTGEVIAADGHQEFVDAIREFELGDVDIQLLECLCCNGCIMGPGISSETPLFRRRAQVSRYVRQRMHHVSRAEWKRNLAEYLKGDLTREFLANDQRIDKPSQESIQQILRQMGKTKAEDELNCGACGYDTCREHAIAIYRGIAESEMCLPYTIEQLKKTCGELMLSHEQLATAQDALMQSEKLASMGQLAAGIAHEVNNPLSTVLMLSHVLLDESRPDAPEREDLAMIVSEADRCKKIVAGLLHFARENRVEVRREDVGGLIARVVLASKAPDNITMHVEPVQETIWAEVDRDQIIQVLTNLVQNAIAAMPVGGTITFRYGQKDSQVWFSVSDTGVGIPEENNKKVFEPFFTTKKAGEGTGLGLAVVYGIVKMHHGDIRLESNADPAVGPTGTTFTVTLPKTRRTPITGDAA
ncbi:MAG TPA: histidine kinase [Planctomycetaceae bacterium]|nr:histidine kinase [Planctomycetaceae bacterium]